MISLQNLNGKNVVLNAELIESVEASSPNTVITLTNGNRFVVKDTVEEVLAKVVEYKRKILSSK